MTGPENDGSTDPSEHDDRMVATFCRICPSLCGLILTISDGAVVSSIGDRDHAATQGYCCRKGRNIGRLHDKSQRFLTAQRGDRRGSSAPIDTAQAIREIADKLTAIRDEHGPDAIGLFLGTQAYQATPTIPVVEAWLRAVGSHKYFRTLSIDQSAKVVAMGRLGSWEAGRQRFDEADAWFFVGTNPLVSMQGGPLGFPVHRGRRAVREARENGLDLIVADPRITETALEADVHLQLRPGTDSLLIVAMLNVILLEGLYDAEFCREHVVGLEDLERAITEVTPETVSGDVGIAADLITDAARRFGRARKGMAVTGTGPDMGPWSNLNEHLVQCLNVVCGRFPRAGEKSHTYAVLGSSRPKRAQVVAPGRPWEHGYQSRFGFGLLGGDLPTATLPREITEPGADRLRALIVIGGNPASAIPDQAGTVDALSQLELLVAVEPFNTETARLSDYVIAPAMMLERPDSTRQFDDWYTDAFAQYTPAIQEAPPGVIEDWKFFAALAAQMKLSLTLGPLAIEPDGTIPSTDDLIDHLARHGQADMDELRTHDHGHVFSELERPTIVAADETRGMFEVLPPDVEVELRNAVARERIPLPSTGESLLAVRRTISVMNSLGRRLSGLSATAYNPCHIHPRHLADAGAEPGDLLEIRSAHGRILAVAVADDTLLYGVVTMSHCFGDLPGLDDDPTLFGSNPGRLLSLAVDVEDINAMPRMTAVPVSVSRHALSIRPADETPA